MRGTETRTIEDGAASSDRPMALCLGEACKVLGDGEAIVERESQNEDVAHAGLVGILQAKRALQKHVTVRAAAAHDVLHGRDRCAAQPLLMQLNTVVW